MTQEEIIRTLAETESRSKSNTHRLDAVEKDQKAISQLASSVAEEPAQRWKSVVDKVLMVLVGALVSWALAKLGIY